FIVSEATTDVFCAGVLENIRSMVSPECFRTWFKDLAVQGVEDRTLQVVAPNRYVKLWLDSHYKKEVLNAAAALNAQITAVNLTVRLIAKAAPDSSTSLAQVLNGALPHAAQPQTASAPVAPRIATNASQRRIMLAANLRLERFLVGRCNR